MARFPPPTREQLRGRLAAWTRAIYEKNRYSSVMAMSQDMDYNQGSLNQIINGKGTVGLEFAIKFTLVGQESLDTICLREPADPRFQRAGPPSSLPVPSPAPASVESAARRKRRSENGQ